VALRKSVIVVLALLGLGVAGVYLASPWWAARQLGQAVQRGDGDAIAGACDMPAIRDGLKAQIGDALRQKIGQGDALAMLGSLVAPAVADRAIDAAVTPDGIAYALRTGRPPDGATDSAVAGRPIVDGAGYRDFDHFGVRLRQGPVLVFERRGFAEWKLVRIDLSGL
jgi:hypothetical protein